MAKYGIEKWFCRSTTPEGLNNRKNIWNRRYAWMRSCLCACQNADTHNRWPVFYLCTSCRNKAVVFEVLYQIYHEGKTEDEALASLDALLASGSLKTPTVAGLAFHLRERGVVSCPDKKAAVDHILLTLIRYATREDGSELYINTVVTHSKLNPESAAMRKGSVDPAPVEEAAVEAKHAEEVPAPASLAGQLEAPRVPALVAQ